MTFMDVVPTIKCVNYSECKKKGDLLALRFLTDVEIDETYNRPRHLILDEDDATAVFNCSENLDKYMQKVKIGDYEATDVMNKVLHDIRHPFLGLKAILKQINNGNIDKTKIKKFTTDLENKIEYVDKLITNILQNSKNIIEMKSLDAKETINKILQLSFIHLKKDIQLDIPQIKVFGNEDKLQRIMHNLISNAFEANPKNPNICIAARIQDEKVIFEVRNQGSFIDDSKKNKIFNPYFTSGKENGIGLGLALCKELVSSMNGDIWYESNRETETTAFFFSLPRKSHN